MPALSFDGLLVIALVAVAVPVLLALVPRCSAGFTLTRPSAW
jgi:hypothetical protein